jgi:signal transduction histidine kinase
VSTVDGAARQSVSPQALHELRTPLGQIIGYAELLAERAEEVGDERFGPDLQKISAAGYRMVALLDELFSAGVEPGGLTWEDAELLRDIGAGDRVVGAPEREHLAALSVHVAALLPPRASGRGAA